MAIENLGMQAAQAGINEASGFLGGLTNRIFAKRDRKNQLEQQEKLTGIQESSNLRMLEAQAAEQERMFGITHGAQIQGQKDMFDYTYKSAGDKAKELKDAGLNVGLAYGNALGGGGGTTGGASGQMGGGASGGTGGHASSEAELRQARSQELGLRLQRRMQEEQIKLLEAQREDVKSQTEERTGINRDIKSLTIENITEEIENKRVQREGMFLQNNYDEMRNALQSGTFNDNVKLMEYQAKQAEANVKKLLEEVHSMDIDNRLKLQNFKELSERIKLENEQILADIFVKGSQGRLNNTMAEGIVKELGMKMQQLGINMDSINNDKEFNKLYKYAAELGAETQRDNNLNSNITMITSTLLGIIGLTAGTKGKAKPVKGFGR